MTAPDGWQVTSILRVIHGVSYSIWFNGTHSISLHAIKDGEAIALERKHETIESALAAVAAHAAQRAADELTESSESEVP